MKRRVLAIVLVFASMGLIAARPSLSDLQAQIDALWDAVNGIGGVQIAVGTSGPDTTTFKNATATCPAGTLALGGGFRLTYPPGSGGSPLLNSWTTARFPAVACRARMSSKRPGGGPGAGSTAGCRGGLWTASRSSATRFSATAPTYARGTFRVAGQSPINHPPAPGGKSLGRSTPGLVACRRPCPRRRR